MYVGFTVSLLAHLLLLGWALVTFQATPPFKVQEPEPVEVALISPDELVRLTKGDRTSKNLKTQFAKQPEETPVKKQAKRPLIKTVQPPPASEPPPAETPDDIAEKLAALQSPKPKGPTLEELAAKAAAEADKVRAEKAAAELALKKAAEEERKKKAKLEEERRKKEEAEKKRKADAARRKKEAARKKKLAEKRARTRKRKLAEKRRRERERRRKARKFDSGKISALLNKIPDAKAPAAGSQQVADRSLPKGPQAGAPEGRDTRLTASEQSFLRSRIASGLQPCWILPGAGGGRNAIPVVTLRWRLKRDGTLDGKVRVMNPRSDAVFAAASAAAQRAIIQCQPIRLPQDLYANWRTIEWDFDPREMQ